MTCSPVIVGAPNGGWDLFVVRPNHAVSHAYVPSAAGLLNPTWEDLGGVVYEIDAGYDKTTGLLVLFAHGGPAGVGGMDKTYVRTRSANGWGDWIRVDNIDVC